MEPGDVQIVVLDILKEKNVKIETDLYYTPTDIKQYLFLIKSSQTYKKQPAILFSKDDLCHCDLWRN